VLGYPGRDLGAGVHLQEQSESLTPAIGAQDIADLRERFPMTIASAPTYDQDEKFTRSVRLLCTAAQTHIEPNSAKRTTSRTASPCPTGRLPGGVQGSLAEYARATQDKLAPKPKNLTFEQAAAVGVGPHRPAESSRPRTRATRAESADHRRVRRRWDFAVQIAKAFGAEVTGMCSTTKMDMVRSLGADHVIDYTVNDVTDAGQRYDVILDIGGNRSLTHLRRALTLRGTLVLVGGETGGRWLAGTDRLLRALLPSPFLGQQLARFSVRRTHKT
jgi:hypothetical protein